MKKLKRFEEEKAHSSAATQERAAELKNACETFSNSDSDYMFSAGKNQPFLDFLPRSPDNAITAEQLGNLLHMDERAVTRLIQRYRLVGVPICASCCEPHGYFVAEGPEMLARYLNSLDGRLREITRTREAMSKNLDAMTGQSKLDGF